MADDKKTYVGVAPLTNVKRTGNMYQAVLSGAPVPGDALPEEIERLEREGFIMQANPEDVGGMQVDVPGQTLADLNTPDARSARDKAKADADAKAKADAAATPPAAPTK